MPNGKGLTQAYNLRDALASEALALLAVEAPADIDQRSRRASAATALVKGWEAASDRIRIARGQPLPGSRRPAPQRQSNRSQSRRGLAPQQPPKPPATEQP